jgi:prepilin-type N-terminal cleavage/methylation domain-containing protein
MLKKRNGFTVIELAVVTVIIGIITALAIMRYINLKNEASDAAYGGVLSSLRSANNILFAQRAARGIAGTITMGDIVSAANIQGATVGEPSDTSVTVQIGAETYTALLNPIPEVPATMGAINDSAAVVPTTVTPTTAAVTTVAPTTTAAPTTSVASTTIVTTTAAYTTTTAAAVTTTTVRPTTTTTCHGGGWGCGEGGGKDH